MRNLIQLIIRYYFFLLFLFLEGISLFILIRYNHFQRASFTGVTSSVQGYLNQKFGGVRDYFYLRKVNENLVKENTLLKNQLDRLQQQSYQFLPATDSTTGFRKFLFYQARVLNNSVNKE